MKRFTVSTTLEDTTREEILAYMENDLNIKDVTVTEASVLAEVAHATYMCGGDRVSGMINVLVALHDDDRDVFNEALLVVQSHKI